LGEQLGYHRVDLGFVAQVTDRGRYLVRELREVDQIA
jgi:hypothetical protein